MSRTLLTILTLTLCVGIPLSTGCSSEESPKTPTGTKASTDHDDHDGDDHAHGDGHDGHDDHMHGESISLGTLTIEGVGLEVSVSGDMDPGEEVHVDIAVVSGDVPTSVRLWIGDAAGTGALKSKADGHDDHFHGHAEMPSEMEEGSQLWIEIETATGERYTGSVALPTTG